MALITESLGCKDAAPKYLLDKHYLRKHGKMPITVREIINKGAQT